MTKLFIDCGSPTWYNTHVRRNKKSGQMGATMAERKYDDFSYLDTEEYKDYRQAYLDYLLKHKSKLSVYSNFDVINNAEATWDNQMWLESRGLKPTPVFHFGSDISWLEKYIKAGYGYICIGGLIPNSFSVLKEPLDKLWLNYLTDKKGFPIIKVHGFAVTSPRLVHRYPWFSTDSTSWVKFGMYGSIIIPKRKYGKADYKSAPNVIFLSVRSPKKDEIGKHIDTISEWEKEAVIKYIKSKGFELGKSIILLKKPDYKVKEGETVIEKLKEYDYIKIEKVIEKGVSNNNVMRDTINAMYYQDLGNSVPKWPWALKFKKTGFF